MTVGIFTFELHLRESRSLKGKRQVVKRLKDRLRSRFNVAVTELNEYDGLWQRAALAVVSVADQRDPLDRMFEAIRAEAERLVRTGTNAIPIAQVSEASSCRASRST